MVINTNIPSAYASRVLSGSTNALAKALAKLSSGSRIVSPEDDAAGLAQSMKFSAEIGRIGAARANVGNAISFSQTQDGFMSKIDTALRRMSELATLSADQTKSATDVANYEKEFAELKSFITKSATKTFNTVGLFSASELKDKDLSSIDDESRNARYDALLKTQDTALTTAFDAFVAAPSNLADQITFTGGKATAADNLIETTGAHNLNDGQAVIVRDRGVATGLTVGTTYYVKTDANAAKFSLYTTAAMNTLAAVGADSDGSAGKALVIESVGNYDKLAALRKELGNMAMEWEQKETNSIDRTKQDWSGATTTSVKQVSTATIAGNAATDTFNVTINGKSLATAITMDTTGGDAAAKLANTAIAIRDAINADTDMSAAVVATAALGVVTLTSTVAGNSFTLSATPNNVSGGAAPTFAVATTTQNVAGVDASSTLVKTWGDVHDFWQTRTGQEFAGAKAHVEHATRQAADIINVTTALTDALVAEYKSMYSAVRGYVNNNSAGLEVTDSSDASTFQLKGADVSSITDAIANSTDTNSLSAVMTKTNAASYVTNINTLINNLAGSRAYVGANISRLNMVDSQLAVYGENLAAANSRIIDVDVAVESANYAKQQILVQSGTAMLAQANLLSQSALRLLS